jgi:hypothetical protein
LGTAFTQDQFVPAELRGCTSLVIVCAADSALRNFGNDPGPGYAASEQIADAGALGASILVVEL